jgi:16S rRNA (adenine1518-N6/adenine1519-N6)-dimethyltransferase
LSAGEIRALLARHGLAARRSLGQNFLVDPRRAEKLVALAGVAPGDAVLEIGTGLGILTRALAARGARVTTIEVDPGLLRALRAEALLPDGVRLVEGDALAQDLAALLEVEPPPRRVVANLPYSVAAPLLRRLLDLAGRLEDWSVMLQRDVAARLLAAPGTRDYGSLTVLHRLVVDTRRCDELAPGCFHPAPKVRSTFLRMLPLRPAPLGADELVRVERLVRAAFGTRRKTLANALRAAGLEGASELLAAAGIDPRARAEALAPEIFASLARALSPSAFLGTAQGGRPQGRQPERERIASAKVRQ